MILLCVVIVANGRFFPYIIKCIYPTEDEINSLKRLGRYILAANDFKLAC